MSSIRAPSLIFTRAARNSIARTSRPVQQAHLAFARPNVRAPRWAVLQTRWQSQDGKSGIGEGLSKFYAFEDIQELISKPSKDRILVDTREPGELQDTGRIPTAVNIPVTSAPDAFFLSEEEFEDRFGFQRPSKDQEVIFYCKAGVRSRAAAQLARQAGWEKTGEYAGSWLDWSGKGGEIKR